MEVLISHLPNVILQEVLSYHDPWKVEHVKKQTWINRDLYHASRHNTFVVSRLNQLRDDDGDYGFRRDTLFYHHYGWRYDRIIYKSNFYPPSRIKEDIRFYRAFTRDIEIALVGRAKYHKSIFG